MSEAKDFSGTPPASVVANEGVVVLFPPPVSRERVPPLTAQEILQIRQLIKDFTAVKTLCPIARNATKQD